MEKVLEIKCLSKAFNGKVAVDCISFDLGRAEILGILGPNGAGKTTTMHTILGLITPTSGEIRIFGKELSEDRAGILKRVNFSSSYVSLPYSLTVIENMRVFAGLYGVKKPEKKILELLDTFGILDIKDDSTRKLSSGQLTRISLAKALVNDPEILFLDEPTASLDPDMADRTRSLLRRIRDERGLSMLYTSHNMKEMEEMCDRVIFLDEGKIVAEGRPGEIAQKFGAEGLEDVFLKIARKS